MKFTLEKEGQNVIKLDIEVEAAQALKTYETVCKQFSHRLNIPGFRKGKAPRNMVERLVGVDNLKQEALDSMWTKAVGEIIRSEKLDIITEPSLNEHIFEFGAPLKLQGTVEIRPEVQLGNYRGLKITVEEATLPKDALEKRLNSIAETKATLQTIAPRQIQAGDHVLLDFECFVNDKLVEGGKAQGLLLEIKDNNFLPGFCEQLVGKQPGDHVEVKSRFPEEYRNTELAGNEGIFKVEVKEIREKAIPELTDELAASFGHESLETLKVAVQSILDEELEGENEARKQKAIVDAVVNEAQVEIPDSMVEREVNLLLSQMKNYVEQSGASWEDFVSQPTYPNIYKEKQEEARRRVQTSLILGAIVRAEELSVTEKEITPYLMELIQRYSLPVEEIQRNEHVQRAFQQMQRQATEEALTHKVLDYLIGQSTIEVVPETVREEAKVG